ncbi:GNAT family N-acetyltransferase [Chloroflexia bacterium SDU3-3]|nr:GNAT family N-acetyltransferase [Chloroflexia bacterium SDU3-3]
MSLTIRPAQIDDAGGLAALLRSIEGFTRLAEAPEESVLTQVAEQLQHAVGSDRHTMLVAQHGSQIVGYVAITWMPCLFLKGGEGFVSELFIHASERGQGLGAQLLDAAKAEAAARGCTRMGLLNMRDRESYQRGFYAKHGWVERESAANFLYFVENA